MMVLFDGCPDCWTKMESHQQKWDHFECSSTVIKTMPNGGKLTLEKKFFMCCRSAIFERLPKFRSLSHQHPEEHYPGHPAIEHVSLVHASTIGGLQGIFNTGKISPSILHDPDSMSFFALGARRTGDQRWDAQELTRLLHNG